MNDDVRESLGKAEPLTVDQLRAEHAELIERGWADAKLIANLREQLAEALAQR